MLHNERGILMYQLFTTLLKAKVFCLWGGVTSFDNVLRESSAYISWWSITGHDHVTDPTAG